MQKNDALTLATAVLEEALKRGRVRVDAITRAALTRASRETPAGQIGEGDRIKLVGKLCWSEEPRATWFEMILERRGCGWERRDIAIKLRFGGQLGMGGDGM